MTRPTSFEDYFRHRQRVRKRDGTPLPLPPAVAPIFRDFGAALAAGPGDAATLEAAIQAAAEAIIAKAAAAVAAARAAELTPPVRPGRRRPTPGADVTKAAAGGGRAWDAIAQGAATLAGKSGPGAMTPAAMAQAVSAFLDTPDGRKLYDQYCAETDAAAEAAARQRRNE